MNPHSPILDQPETIEWDDNPVHDPYRLANQDLYFDVNADTDVVDLFWPWAGELYAKRIALRVSAPREEDLMPMITQRFPGHQELILGTEGVILTKRVAAPRQSEYDRSIIWLLDCQAEGDRLLRLDVEIDWGEPLTQRMVDGLLVAQRNPGPQRGIYNQSNAERTCVFGNPDARPDHIEFTSDQHTHLVYHVLVNGMVEVPLLLTLSDVGEQMAWNGFLALRDADRAFELSTKSWNKLLKTGRLWTPDVALNHAVQRGKLLAMRQVQRLRSGFAATDRSTIHSGALIDCCDLVDIILSRNLLAHLRRVAEKTMGRLPMVLPLHNKEAAIDPELRLVETNAAYLQALVHHLTHHFDATLLATHYQAVGLCIEQALHDEADPNERSGNVVEQLAIRRSLLLRDAVQLATWRQDDTNLGHWQAVLTDLGRQLPQETNHIQSWQPVDTLWDAIAFTGQTIWSQCGLIWQDDRLTVEPTNLNHWPWWALLDLPFVDDRTLSLYWDGTTLHSTQPIVSSLPTQQWDTIRARGTDELEFDLHFELQSEVDGEKRTERVHPQFLQAPNY